MKKIMGKKFLIGLVACLIFTRQMYPIEMALRVTPELTFPAGDMKETIGNIVYGARLNYDFNLFGFLNLGPEFNFDYIPKIGAPKYILDFAPGICIGGYYNLSRFTFEADAAVGIHFASYNYPGKLSADGTGYIVGKEPGNVTASNLYMRFSADVLFRVSPGFSVGVGGGYKTLFLNGAKIDSQSLLAGFQAGVVTKFSFDTVKSSGKISGRLNQDEGIFPLYANLYKTNGFAYISITNSESSEINDVNVSFRAGKYTASLLPCGRVKRILRNKTERLPLMADFSSAIFGFTENGQIPGEVVIEYKLLGKKKTAVEPVVINVNNRNSFQWADPNTLALFVSPNSETVLELSKAVVGNARDNLRTGLNRNMQFAMYIVESINTMGIARVPDASSPYAQSHLDSESLDFIQYPFQTLTYSSGDSDDLGILTASLLSSAGIDAAFIPLSDDFIVCVSLGAATSAKNLVNEPEKTLVIVDDVAWLPLSMNDLKKGFNASWKSALKAISAQIDAGQDMELIVLQDVWESCPPMGFDGKANYTKPSAAEVRRRATNELNYYISSELNQIIRRLRDNVSKDPSESNYNALGMAYVRAGDYASARNSFMTAYRMGSTSAMMNLANIASIQKNYAEAKRLYNEILKKEPDHSGAKKALERLEKESGNK